MATSGFDVEEQKIQSKMFKALNKQRLEDKYCDVVLSVSNYMFPAHRNILSASSEYFNAMFSSKMEEQYKTTIPFKEISSVAMQQVLDFIYCNDFFLIEENLIETLQAASMMRILDLVELISNFFIGELEAVNCLQFRDMGILYSLESLVSEANRCIRRNFTEVFLQSGFCNLKLEEIIELIASDELTVDDESIVFEALIRWICHDLDEREKHFPDIFKYVRLQYISIDYLADEVRKFPSIRTYSECQDLVDDAFHFHVSSKRFKMESPRRGQLCLKSNCILLFGGNAMLRHHINDESWTSLKIPTHPPSNSCAVAVHNGTTFFCGGLNANNQPSNKVTIFHWNKTFLKALPMETERANAAATVVNDVILVFGGEISTYFQPEVYGQTYRNIADSFEGYHVCKKKWKILGKLKTPRSGATAVTFKDCSYLMGGYWYIFSQRNFRQLSKQASAVVEIYNSKDREWTDGNNMNTARASFGAAIYQYNIYVTGGINSNNQSLNSTEFMDTRSGQWTSFAQCNPWGGVTTSCCVEDKIYALGMGDSSLYLLDVASKRWDKTAENFLRNGNCQIVAPIHWRR